MLEIVPDMTCSGKRRRSGRKQPAGNLLELSSSHVGISHAHPSRLTGSGSREMQQ